MYCVDKAAGLKIGLKKRKGLMLVILRVPVMVNMSAPAGWSMTHYHKDLQKAQRDAETAGR